MTFCVLSWMYVLCALIVLRNELLRNRTMTGSRVRSSSLSQLSDSIRRDHSKHWLHHIIGKYLMPAQWHRSQDFLFTYWRLSGHLLYSRLKQLDWSLQIMFRSLYSSRGSLLCHISKTTRFQEVVRFNSSNVIVSFKQVSFGYTDTKMLLDDASFNIRDGESICNDLLNSQTNAECISHCD